MSFWDGVKAFGDFMKERMDERQARIRKYQKRYENDPDTEKLIRMYRSTSSMEKKLGIGLVLKKRGYGRSDLEG